MRIWVITAISIVALGACGAGTPTDISSTSGEVDTTGTAPAVLDTTTTTTAPMSTTSSTNPRTGDEAQPAPIYTVMFSERATGVVAVDTVSGRVVRELTGAIGQGASSLDYVEATDSLVYSRTVTASMSEVVQVPVSGGDPTVLTSGSEVDASNDGRRLAVARLELVEGRPDRMILEVRDFDGKVINRWSDDSTSEEPVVVGNLAWGPDATSLAFEIRFEDGTEVFLLDPASQSGSIQEVSTRLEPTGLGDERMRSAPFWLDDGRLGMVEACCSLESFETWDVIVVDPDSGEKVATLFSLDRPITEVDTDSDNARIAFITSHDAFGSPDDIGPNRLMIWTAQEGMRDIGEGHTTIGW